MIFQDKKVVVNNMHRSLIQYAGAEEENSAEKLVED